MNFVLKAPGTTRLKLHYDELPFTFAFKLDLRCYIMVGPPALRHELPCFLLTLALGRVLLLCKQ